MPGTIGVFEFTPKLKTLDLASMHAEAYILFPAENLVVFSDTRPLPEHDTVPEYLDTIASAPNLLEFTCHHYSVVPDSPGPYHPQIVHQSLRTLSASLGALFCSLVLPALTDMTLASVKAQEEVVACPTDALLHLYDLIYRSQYSLTTLTFIDAIMDEDLLPILQLSPQLVSLTFQDQPSSRESDATMVSLFVAMTETVHVGDTLSHALLPVLKELEILLNNVEMTRVEYLDFDFVEMVVSRRVPPESQMLEYLRIDVIGKVFVVPMSYDGGLEELNRLGDNGLDFQLDIAD